MWATCPGKGITVMRPWKVVLGLGAACVACCAAPLLGGVVAWTAGGTALAGAASALRALLGGFAPLVAAMLLLSVAGGVLVWRLMARRTRQPAGCAGGCSVGNA